MPDTTKKKWIQGAIKKPGALHKQLGVPEGKKIPEAKIVAAKKKAKPGSLMKKRLTLADTLKKINKKK